MHRLKFELLPRYYLCNMPGSGRSNTSAMAHSGLWRSLHPYPGPIEGGPSLAYPHTPTPLGRSASQKWGLPGLLLESQNEACAASSNLLLTGASHPVWPTSPFSSMTSRWRHSNIGQFHSRISDPLGELLIRFIWESVVIGISPATSYIFYVCCMLV